jgi:hypothetical protein
VHRAGRPSCPPCAAARQPSSSSRAFVTTTPIVVLVPTGTSTGSTGRSGPGSAPERDDVAGGVHDDQRADDEGPRPDARRAEPRRPSELPPRRAT